jgi:hypothetical protein
MFSGRFVLLVGLAVCLVGGTAGPLDAATRAAQPPAMDANALVRVAVKTELAAARDDRSRWRYRDEEKEKGDSVSIVVETDAGSVKRLIAKGGRPLTAAQARAEDARVEAFVQDPARQAKQRRDGASDGDQARELLELLPKAFTWTVVNDEGSSVRLHFEPDPAFHPPSLQARVLSAMNGELVVDKAQHRVVTMSGRLTHEVTFGFGVLGRLRAGGTFRVERRQVAPGLWQITETHVHIDGRALLFKSIGQQQDEIETDFTPVAAGTTLEAAAVMSRPREGVAAN